MGVCGGFMYVLTVFIMCVEQQIKAEPTAKTFCCQWGLKGEKYPKIASGNGWGNFSSKSLTEA